MLQESRCYWLGERAVVLELEPPVSLSNQQRIWGLCAALQESEQVMEVVPGMNNITVILMQPELMPHAIDWLTAWWEKSASLEMENRQVNIPVIYGGEAGPDLNDVAKYCQMSANQVVEAHSAADYVVYFIGFQPGFPYLGGLDSRLHVPRRAEPRLCVPAGSVAIGGSQTGVYPLATPGGWQLIGQTTVPLFTPHAASPTYLRPGDIVRFVPQQEGVC